MKFSSIRIIAQDLKHLVQFYEEITATKADWLAPVFAEIVTPTASLAFGASETVALFQAGSAEPKANRSVIIELQVADVDADYERLKDHCDIVHPPKLMPWGNKTFQLRDPEGTLVSFYTPVSEQAKARFNR